jgi:AcrR family transcriptional regulator
MSKGAETRQAILHHGVEAAARVGLSGLTIGELATATGMSKSGLFAHVKSKETLQLQVLAQAREEFIDDVVRPALAVQRGEPRVRALFDRWLTVLRDNMPGGCLFIKSAAEYDDRPGPVRDQLVRDHTDLRETVAQVFRTGIGEGHFRDDADPDQFANDVQGVLFSYYHAHRLLNDPHAEAQARRAFDALIAAVRR